jgi:hypothetical protein
MRATFAGAILLLAGWQSVAYSDANAAANLSLVLVANPQVTFKNLSIREVRRLFLGIPVSKNGERLTALRHYSSPLLKQVFLQKIIFMSERNYERQLMLRTFRFGNSRPKILNDIDSVFQALENTVNGVSYMWSSDAAKIGGFQIVDVLWSKSAH